MTSKEQLAYYKQQCEEQANCIIELNLLLEIERQAYKNLTELYDIDTKSLLQQNEKLKQQVDDLENNQETVLTTFEISVQQNEKFKKAIIDMLNYLSKEPNKVIPKHSIKQTFNKFLKEVLGE